MLRVLFAVCVLLSLAHCGIVVRTRTPVVPPQSSSSSPTVPSQISRLFARLSRATHPSLAPSLSSTPAISFARIFNQNMVLQRSASAIVWGFVVNADPSCVAFASYGAVSGNAFINTIGNFSVWAAELNIPNATTVGAPLAVSLNCATGKSAVSLSNVIVGDVYLCGGQSNMQFTVAQEINGTQEIQNAKNYPNIRVFTVGQGTVSSTPLADFATVRQTWTVASAPGALGDASLDWQYFSAVCWEFGRQLYDKIQTPIGLISNNWGGTIIEAWMDPDTYHTCNVPPVPPSSKSPNQPYLLYNAMLVPMAALQLSGFVWYQGESNVAFAGGSESYACLFPAFIRSWQADHYLPGTREPLPFIFVQLSSYNGGDDLPNLRWVQVNSTLGMQNVGYAVSIDIGDPNSPFGDIHPDDKITLGKRLFYTAMNIVYKSHVQSYKGPAPVYIARNGTGLTLGFTSHSKFPNVDYRPSIYKCGTPPIKLESCAGFEVSVGGHWTKCASPQPQSSTGFFYIDCGIPAGTPISQVRYMWGDWGLSFLYNRGGLGPGTDGLPAEPFWMVVPQN